VGGTNVVGVIGDTHEPFAHPRYLDFVKSTFKKHGVKTVVHVGDLVDNHAISRHDTEPCAMGALAEFNATKAQVAKWTEAFPRVLLCQGNHDSIPTRQLHKLGIPSTFLKSFKDLWGLPEGWVIKDSHVVDGVLYRHGIGSSGKNGAYNGMLATRQSIVQGHVHAFGGVMYHSNSDSLAFGLSAGCGIDVEAYAFAYGKHCTNRPILGCGIVRGAASAQFVPMDMKRWSRHNGGKNNESTD
jgi:predicted phosphodiesterase